MLKLIYGDNMLRKIKKLLSTILFILILCLIFLYKKDIAKFILQTLNLRYTTVELDKSNIYSNNNKYEFSYVKKINKFEIKNKQDLINAFYSILDSGENSFTFYCSKKYHECKDDLKDISENQTILSNINSFVQPFNSFNDIKITYDMFGKIEINITKSYTEEEINKINNEVDKIIRENIKSSMDDKEKIKTIHDYIINNTKYDSDRSDRNIIKYKSNIAYGPLFEHYGICGGYTDTMALFLNKFNIPNFKIISENHIWNAVLLDGKWYHLDLTWDDPVEATGKDTLQYNIFLISTKELEEINDGEHTFDKEVFQELK